MWKVSGSIPDISKFQINTTLKWAHLPTVHAKYGWFLPKLTMLSHNWCLRCDNNQYEPIIRRWLIHTTLVWWHRWFTSTQHMPWRYRVFFDGFSAFKFLLSTACSEEKLLRRPGIEPGSQEWESCMIPLHQRRLQLSSVDGWTRDLVFPVFFMQSECYNLVWRCRGLNPRPFTCKANALPLSYIPTLIEP